MSTGIMGVVKLLLVLTVLMGQWTGILGLARTNRNLAWWSMFAGICCTTVGFTAYHFLEQLMMENPLRPPSTLSYLSIGSGELFWLGLLLFAIGFAIHGQQTFRVHQRITELEAIAAAQSEELNRLRAS